MVAAEPAALTFHPTLLVAAVVTGLAVPGFETVVRAERDPAFVLLTRPPEQHLLDRAVEVVVADLVDRHSTEPFERIHVALQESLLPLGRERPMRRTPRKRQPHGEQRGLGLHPGQHHPQVVKVDLGLGRRRVSLGYETHLQRLTCLRGDLWTTFTNMITHRGIRQSRRTVLID